MAVCWELLGGRVVCACVKGARCLGWFLGCWLGGEVGNGMLGAGADSGSGLQVFGSC